MQLIFIVSLLIGIFATTVTVSAQTLPQQITYQGKLVQDGIPFSGSTTMIFELINPTTNAIEWTETQTINVQDGLYSVVLGTQTPFTPNFFAQNPSLGLRVSVNGNPLTPVTVLRAVPYAHAAGSVLDNSITSVKITNGTIQTIDIASGGQNKVLATDANGQVVWIDRTSITTPTPTLQQVLNAGNSAGDVKITSLGIPTDPKDAANKAYVDAITGGGLQDLSNSDGSITISNGVYDGSANETISVTDGGITTTKLADNAVTTNKIASSGSPNQILSTDANSLVIWQDANTIFTETDPKVGSLATGNVPVWNGTSLANSSITDNGGDVEINTSADFSVNAGGEINISTGSNAININSTTITLNQNATVGQNLTVNNDMIVNGVFEIESNPFDEVITQSEVVSFSPSDAQFMTGLAITDYVASQLSGIPTYTFQNGLTNTSGTVNLGGILTQPTTINASTNDFIIGNNSSSQLSLLGTNANVLGNVVNLGDPITTGTFSTLNVRGQLNTTRTDFINYFDGTNNLTLEFPISPLSTNQRITFPDNTGTVALLSDIPTTTFTNGLGDISGSIGIGGSDLIQNTTLNANSHDFEIINFPNLNLSTTSGNLFFSNSVSSISMDGSTQNIELDANTDIELTATQNIELEAEQELQITLIPDAVFIIEDNATNELFSLKNSNTDVFDWKVDLGISDGLVSGVTSAGEVYLKAQDFGDGSNTLNGATLNLQGGDGDSFRGGNVILNGGAGEGNKGRVFLQQDGGDVIIGSSSDAELRINGWLYLPSLDPTPSDFTNKLYVDGGGNLRWQDTYINTSSSPLVFENGLTNAFGTITLGGNLTENTILTTAPTFDLLIDGTGGFGVDVEQNINLQSNRDDASAVASFLNATNQNATGDAEVNLVATAQGSGTSIVTLSTLNQGGSQEGYLRLETRNTGVSTAEFYDVDEIRQINDGTTTMRVGSYDNATSPSFVLERARGNLLTQTSVVTGDILGEVGFTAYNGANFILSAGIRADAALNPTVNGVPSNLHFYTANPNGDIEEKMVINTRGVLALKKRINTTFGADNTFGRLFVGDIDGELYYVPADGSTTTPINISAGATNPWSLNGSNIYYNGGGTVGIGDFSSSTPLADLHIKREDISGATPANILLTSYENNPNVSTSFILQKARGTELSPTTLSLGDKIGEIVFNGHNTSSFQDVGKIEMVTSFSGATIGADMIFSLNGSNIMSLKQNDIVVLGNSNNNIDPAATGATISGGGQDVPLRPNTIQNSSAYATISGGHFNKIGVGLDANAAVIGGGFDNIIAQTAFSPYSIIAGGRSNRINASTATIVGGEGNQANGNFSTVGGYYNVANSFGETVLGVYSSANVANSATAFDAGDRLFVIGNGIDGSNRSNALVMLKNGNTTINGGLTVNPPVIAPNATSNGESINLRGQNIVTGGGNPQDAATLLLEGGKTTAGGNVNLSGGFSLNNGGGNLNLTSGGSFSGSAGQVNITGAGSSSGTGGGVVLRGGDAAAGGGSITLQGGSQSVGNGQVRIQLSGGNTTIGNASSITTINGNLTVTGSFTPPSDIRYKENVTTLNNSLSNILSIRGTQYYWKDKQTRGERLQFGVIAQEIEEVFPNLVRTDEEGFKSVHYIDLIPVLIEATKEQQTIIDKQKEQINTQNTKIEDLQKQIADLKQIVATLQDKKENNESSNSALAQKVELLEKQLTALVESLSNKTENNEAALQTASLKEEE